MSGLLALIEWFKTIRVKSPIVIFVDAVTRRYQAILFVLMENRSLCHLIPLTAAIGHLLLFLVSQRFRWLSILAGEALLLVRRSSQPKIDDFGRRWRNLSTQRILHPARFTQIISPGEWHLCLAKETSSHLIPLFLPLIAPLNGHHKCILA